MFSDFRQHVIGVPQIVAAFGNVVFDGPGANEEFSQLVDFVRHGLLDPRILPTHLKTLVPKRVPSGRPTLDFE
jgi:hypothetical protein